MTYPINGNRGRGGLSIRQFVLHIKDWLTEALSGKQDTLEFDDAPTAGSTNPVTSDGVKTALDGKLDKSGGTMTGNIIWSGGVALQNDSTDAYSFEIYSGTTWNDSPRLALYPTGSSATNAGRFVLSAGANAYSLTGTPNGNLTWNGKEIERVNSSGTNWIRYESGLQMVWMSLDLTTAAKTMTFPVAFSGSPIVTVGSNSAVVAFVTSLSSTGGTVNLASYGSTSRAVRVFAIGKWK